jgi:signal transduction histidine kinase
MAWGRIQVSSNLGRGSDFAVELPVLRREAAATSESDQNRP